MLLDPPWEQAVQTVPVPVEPEPEPEPEPVAVAVALTPVVAAAVPLIWAELYLTRLEDEPEAELELPEVELYEPQLSSNAVTAASASPSGQEEERQERTSDERFSQIHSTAARDEHSELSFSTWETQANKQAGGVAMALEAKAAKATTEEKTEARIS